MPRGRKTQITLHLSAMQRGELEALQRSTMVQAGLVRRARLVLLLARGDRTVADVARLVGMRRNHLYKWVKRFKQHGVDGLCDLRRGRHQAGVMAK
jgi:transcriptional regulator of acetoin/glycerol metabolism